MKQPWCVDCQRDGECARHAGLGVRRVFGEPTARLPLTQFHVDEIARRVRAVQDDTGWGEVTLIIEDGRIHAMRSGSSQLLLDSLVAKPLRNPHGAES